MSIAGALRILAEKVPPVPQVGFAGEPMEAAHIKAVPSVPQVPPEKLNGQPKSANDAPPTELIRLARLLSKAYGDDKDGQAAMVEDIRASDPATWPALLEYFQERLKLVTCGSCGRGESIACTAIIRCLAGVESGLPTGGFWATDRHVCPWFHAQP